ncbi:MAG: hypothetical protein ACYTGZ_13910 [Planctomycetota bacterium]|jgi:hypothetical protein
MTVRRWWIASALVSLALAMTLGYLWHRMDRDYQPNPEQLVDADSVRRHLKSAWELDPAAPKGGQAFVPTGLFIESLVFTSASDVNLTGYVWQRYTKGVHDGVKRGFIFPEAVESGTNVPPRVAYRQVDGDEETIGWYFEVTVRQQFDYTQYPLDHKTVWARLWPEEFGRDVFLVPDLGSYDSTAPGTSFGLDHDLALSGWDVEETFFQYHAPPYDTDFGIPGRATSRLRPELYFNVVIRRDFLNAFIVNLLPLLVVVCLVFGSLLTVTMNERKHRILGSSFSTVLSTCALLFFTVAVAHIRLRQQFGTATVVYLEYFYLLAYLIIGVVAVNGYMFYMGFPLRVIQHADNLIPKLLYWPFTLGAALATTLTVL